GATRHKHSVAWHGISIDIYTVSMGISTRSDSGRAPPNTADSDPARSTQTRESIVAFKLPSYSGGLSLPEFRATSGRIRTDTHVLKSLSYEKYVLFFGNLNSGQCKRYMLLCNSHSNGNVRGCFGKDLHEDGEETRPVN
ncbi:hypothetical protein ALC60_09225, partial [Trachymyrmex zeteki]